MQHLHFLSDFLKDTAYKLGQFNQQQITALEQAIITEEVRGKVTPYMTCLVRQKKIKLTPEEAVR